MRRRQSEAAAAQARTATILEAIVIARAGRPATAHRRRPAARGAAGRPRELRAARLRGAVLRRARGARLKVVSRRAAPTRRALRLIGDITMKLKPRISCRPDRGRRRRRAMRQPASARGRCRQPPSRPTRRSAPTAKPAGPPRTARPASRKPARRRTNASATGSTTPARCARTRSSAATWCRAEGQGRLPRPHRRAEHAQPDDDDLGQRRRRRRDPRDHDDHDRPADGRSSFRARRRRARRADRRTAPRVGRRAGARRRPPLLSSPPPSRRGRPAHHRHRVGHQLVARALALARRHHRLRRGARAGRGVRADGLLPRDASATRTSMPPPRAMPGSRWYATMPDAPCIAICSTSQGDAVCKGCGRTFDEVQRWTEMTPGEKRATWRRITHGRHGLALQPLRRARRDAEARIAAPAAARQPAAGRRRRMTRLGLRQSARRIAPLAWPVFVGQVAVLAFSTVDTVMVARYVGDRPRRARGRRRRLHLGLRRLHGRRCWRSARSPASSSAPASCAMPAAQLHQAMWLGARARRCSAARCCSFPEPFLRAVRRPSPRSRRKVRGYLDGARVRAAAGARSSPPIAASTSPCRGRRR